MLIILFLLFDDEREENEWRLFVRWSKDEDVEKGKIEVKWRRTVLDSTVGHLIYYLSKEYGRSEYKCG